MKMTISIDDDLRNRMRKHRRVNWSALASRAFEDALVGMEADPALVRSLQYADEKLGSALSSLRAPGPIQRRLHGAHVYNLIHVPTAVLPDDVRADFQAMMEACVRVRPSADEGAAWASISQMSDEEAAAHAETVARVEHAVASRLRELGR